MTEPANRRRPAGKSNVAASAGLSSEEEDRTVTASTDRSAEEDRSDDEDEDWVDPATVKKPRPMPSAKVKRPLPSAKKFQVGAYGQTDAMPQLRKTLRSLLTTPQYAYAVANRTSLYQVLEAVDSYVKAQSPGAETTALSAIWQTTAAYLGGHNKPSVSRSEYRRIEAVQEIRDRAQVFISQHLADRAYRDDVAGEDKAKNPFQFHIQTQGVMADTPLRTLENTPASYAEAKQHLTAAVNKFGLTQGELRAIRTYTADNYKYINPAISNYTAGLESHIAPKDKDGNGPAAKPEDIKTARLEGAAHAAMAMKGLRKLPPYTGVAYRGFLLNLDRFKKLFPAQGAGSNDILQGTSKGLDVPAGFLYRGGSAPIEVWMEVHYSGRGAGRDVQHLSTLPHELEVLMLPGAKYDVVSIEKVSYDGSYKKFSRAPLNGEKVSDAPRTEKGKSVKAAYYVVVNEAG